MYKNKNFKNQVQNSMMKNKLKLFSIFIIVIVVQKYAFYQRIPPTYWIKCALMPSMLDMRSIPIVYRYNLSPSDQNYDFVKRNIPYTM